MTIINIGIIIRSKGEDVKNFWSDFKKFISRGNVIDLAVAVIIGGAFGAIVTSLVSDIIMPLICALFKTTDVSELSVKINSTPIYIGKFIQAIIDFLIISFFVFLMIRALNGFERSVKKIENLKTRMLTKEQRKQLKLEGYSRKQIWEKEQQLRKEKEVNSSQDIPVKETTESLLREIRDLMKNEKNKKENEINGREQ